MQCVLLCLLLLVLGQSSVGQGKHDSMKSTYFKQLSELIFLADITEMFTGIYVFQETALVLYLILVHYGFFKDYLTTQVLFTKDIFMNLA